MSTRTLKLVTLIKDGQIWQLRDPAHVAAFLAAGWKVEEEKPIVAESVKKAKSKAKE